MAFFFELSFWSSTTLQWLVWLPERPPLPGSSFFLLHPKQVVLLILPALPCSAFFLLPGFCSGGRRKGCSALLWSGGGGGRSSRAWLLRLWRRIDWPIPAGRLGQVRLYTAVLASKQVGAFLGWTQVVEQEHNIEPAFLPSSPHKILERSGVEWNCFWLICLVSLSLSLSRWWPPIRSSRRK